MTFKEHTKKLLNELDEIRCEHGLTKGQVIEGALIGIGAFTGLRRVEKFFTKSKGSLIGNLGLTVLNAYAGLRAADYFLAHKERVNIAYKNYEDVKKYREADNIHFADTKDPEKEGESDGPAMSFTEWLKTQHKEERHGEE